MLVQEYNYATLEDFSGNTKEYSLDIISPLTEAEAPRPVVFFVHGGGLHTPMDSRDQFMPVVMSWVDKYMK